MTDPTDYRDGASIEARVVRAIHDARLAFWRAVGDAFPEATTGDVDPLAALQWAEASSRAVSGWVEGNVAREPDDDCPPIYDPGTSAAVVEHARSVAARLLAADPSYSHDREDSTPSLYRMVRAIMGRAPVAIVDGGAPYPLGDPEVSS